MLASANLVVRFLLELAAIASVAYWGWQTAGAGLAGLVLGAGAALVLVVIWWALIAPRGRSPIPADVRPYVGSVVLVAAAGLLASAGQPLVGGILAVLVTASTAISAAIR